MADRRDGLRIGDQERDEAVEYLQEHHASGRLTVTEFDDRMSRALGAVVQSDLDALFSDLPEPTPLGRNRSTPPSGASAWVPEHRASHYDAPAQVVEETPWYAQWWMIIVAVFLAGVTRGSFGYIVPIMIMWIWVVYPSIARSRGTRAPRPAPAAAAFRQRVDASLTDHQRREITAQVDAGHDVEAVKLYREFTGEPLAEAEFVIRNWDRQLGL